jgi:FkbM family methyltransferase
MKKVINIVRFYKLGALAIFFRLIRFELRKMLGTNENDLTIAKIYGFKISVPLHIDGIGRALYVHQGRELDHKWMLEQVLRKGDKILDLGANIGYYVLLEAFLLDKECEIFAVEPDERNIRILEQNIKMAQLEGVVHYEQCAISNFTGKATLRMDRKSNLSRLQKASDNLIDVTTGEVSVYDFMEYLSKIGPVDLLRMDIEGGELDIFRSINKRFVWQADRLPARIIFETHNYHCESSDVEDVLRALFAFCYDVEFMSSDDERSKNPIFHSYGYAPILVINEVNASRGIYSGVAGNHALGLISNWQGTRTICLKRRLQVK